MDQILNFGIFLTIIVEYISFFYIIFRKDFNTNSKKKVIGVIIVVILLLVGSFGKWEIAYLLLIGLISSALMAYLILEISFLDTIKLWLVAFPTLSILESIVGYIITVVLTVGAIEETIVYTMCIIAGLWLYYGVLGHRLDKEIFQMPGHIWIAISGVMFLLVGMISYFTYVLSELIHTKGGSIGLVLVTTGGFAIFVLNYVMLYYFNVNQKYRLQTEMLEQYNEQQREYFEQLLQKEQSTMQFRHDIISDLLQMQSFCEKNEYEGMERYLSEMLKDISVISKENYDVGNEIINTMLNSYFNPIKASCAIQIKGYVNNELNISQRDLCVVVSNLIKNATEAIEDCPNDSKKIVFEVRQGKQFLYIKVKNTIQWKKSFFKNNLPITTKKNKREHGFGLKNVVSVAEKYNGSYKYKIDNDYYTAEVQLQV